VAYHGAGDYECRDCGETFTIWRHEAQSYALKNLDLPRRCKSCRERRRKERAAEVAGSSGAAVWHRGA
jgi:hypothetical protein